MVRPEDEELIRRVLEGELARDASEVRAALARDPSLQQRFQELERLDQLLKGAAREERAVLADQDPSLDGAPETTVRQVVQRELEARSAPMSTRRSLPWGA